MKLKWIILLGIIILIGIFVMNTTSASLGTVQQNQCMSVRVLANCTSINLTEVSSTNQTFTINSEMTKNGQTFNYTFCDTQSLGIHTFSWDNYCVDCSKYGCGNSFEVTYDGKEVTLQRSILSLGLVSILVFLFVLIVINIGKLPGGDTFNDESVLLGVNNLKYLRPILWVISWGLLMAIFFISSNISFAHLPQSMFGEFFFMVYRVMFLMTLPAFIIWFVYIIAKLFRDKEIRQMIDRGVEFRGKP